MNIHYTSRIFITAVPIHPTILLVVPRAEPEREQELDRGGELRRQPGRLRDYRLVHRRVHLRADVRVSVQARVATHDFDRVRARVRATLGSVWRPPIAASRAWVRSGLTASPSLYPLLVPLIPVLFLFCSARSLEPARAVSARPLLRARLQGLCSGTRLD